MNAPATKEGADQVETCRVLPLNNVVGLPGEELTFSLSNNELIPTIEESHAEASPLFTICQNLIRVEKRSSQFGVMAEIVEILSSDRQKIRFRLRFKDRREAVAISKKGKDLQAEVRFLQRRPPSAKAIQAATQEAMVILKAININIPWEGEVPSLGPKKLDSFLKTVSRALEFTLEDRITCLQGWSHGGRMSTTVELLRKYQEVHAIRGQLRQRTTDRMRKMERDVFLTEEKRLIDAELGKGQKNCPPEFQDIKEAVRKFSGSEEVKNILEKEFDRLLRTGSNSPHASTIQDYLETVLDLPWGVEEEPNPNWDEVEKILTNSHYGLDPVKDRLLRYLSVVALTGQQPGMILCLVGPPGVGKTSFARAIGEALNLPFVKKSLGGVRDESEIRGHRRTYIGSMPGRIIQGLRKAKCANPVFLLDEIDKLGKDHRGDPASALLEVLDPEENHAFSDHYLELDFDLSKVFWVLTANNESEIPSALHDRLEIIRFSGYTETEKIHIAKDYLTSRCMEKQGLGSAKLKLSDQVIRKVIRQYTREAGVRELQRRISNLVQYLALEKVRGKKSRSWTIGVRSLKEALGPAQHEKPRWVKSSWHEGIMAGLAFTSYGGTVLRMECTTLSGKGELKLTGKLGEVMKESAHTALSFLINHSERLNIETSKWKDVDFHIHIPAGAVPKEGPSAGLGIALLLYSAMTGQKCRPFWALTGEITLHGKVLAIGGVKEKLLAASQEGFQGVLLPEPNEADVEDIRLNELKKMDLRYVKTFWEALDHLFGKKN